MSVTTYLSDGRKVHVPESAVEDWQYEVENGDTYLGLGDWFTKDGENEELIEGSVDDMPRCEHSDHPISVVNISQALRDTYDSKQPLAATLTCRERACILDAMAWVERSTGEQAVWIAEDKTIRRNPPLYEDVRTDLPIGQIEAVTRMDEHGDVEVVFETSLRNYEASLENASDEYDAHDFAHSIAFAFGMPYASVLELIAVEDDIATLRYRTNIEEVISNGHI